jgi:hypothetical protein
MHQRSPSPAECNSFSSVSSSMSLQKVSQAMKASGPQGGPSCRNWIGHLAAQVALPHGLDLHEGR